MRYGIFGDVHGNLEAFKQVIDAYKKENIDNYISVGDIVGYGAEPHQCIEELKKLSAKSVCGNHDRACIGLLSPDYFNAAARAAVKWTEEHLSTEDKEFLKSLQLVIDEDDFNIVHGSMDKPHSFFYIVNKTLALNCFQKMEHDLCFVGHSHVPVVFFMQDNKVDCSYESFIKLRQGMRYIVNVGSIGQPRDGNPLAAFSIYDSKRMTVEIKRVAYNIEMAKSKILNEGLPEILGYRLLEGR